MAVPVGEFLDIEEVVRRATNHGCELREPNSTVVTPWGEMPVRYLFNPATGGTFDISDFSEDEAMGPSTVEAMGRRLGVDLRS